MKERKNLNGLIELSISRLFLNPKIIIFTVLKFQIIMLGLWNIVIHWIYENHVNLKFKRIAPSNKWHFFFIIKHLLGCGKNSYWSRELQECESCPQNSHTVSEGSTSIKYCTCDSGFIGSPENGITCEGKYSTTSEDTSNLPFTLYN